MSPGKQASGGAAAPMAAGARLEAMRRRVRLSRVAIWTVIGAGPIALGVAVASTPTTVEAATSPKPTAAVRTRAVAADPAGYAQLFVHAWLRSSADDATSAQARLAHSMAPDVELPDRAAGAQSTPASVTAVHSAQRAGGAWSVTVAAQFADGTVQYYAVPVSADGAGASFAVTGAPGVVAGPGRAEVPQSPYDVTVPDGDLSSAAGEFLTAYLTGAGEVDRYLAPGVQLTAADSPFSSVSVQQVLAVEETAAAGQIPADGTRVHVLARAEARDALGRWPLAYELALTARSGRWEVSALESGTTLDGGYR
ncbi:MULTISPECIES: conjugal transfer protein [Streptomyces]|uniref:conjugal transfer protein n=1 Tax=Streptomyces TaxID=1883 RepID=UPI000896247F|nr:conjugal transfer protein [Streptomyces sp. PAN_FS17]SEB58708.1 Conjugative transposon protein TcpC [Streptomyces sp. PAN_FS17]SEE11252.1 Conjugative transposon protein TcpC [Streptomyces sp. PAN_FS17]